MGIFTQPLNIALYSRGVAFILAAMNKRDKDYIRGRRSVLDEEQINELKTGHLDRSSRQRNRPFRKIIPVLIFAFIAFMIAREEIPAVSDAWERMVAPDEWQAKQTCQKAALGSAERLEFTRILKPGKISKTTDGLYIERLVIGEMGQSGKEVSIKYSCYLDSTGNLVKLNRIEDASN